MNVTSIDLSAMNTESVTSMEGMFHDCSSLTSLDLTSFNTSKVTNMSSMFYGTSSLKEVRVSNLWDMSSVTNTYHMFAGSGVSSVTVV